MRLVEAMIETKNIISMKVTKKEVIQICETCGKIMTTGKTYKAEMIETDDPDNCMGYYLGKICCLVCGRKK